MEKTHSFIRAGLMSVSMLLRSQVLAHGQTPDCAQALIQDKAILDLQESESLALLELLKRSYSESDDWSAGLTVPIKGIPVQGSAARARKAHEDYFERNSTNWSYERTLSVATQTLSRNSVAAYRACIDGQHTSGPRIFVHDATAEEATVTISWWAPPGASPRDDNAEIQISGARFKSRPPRLWSSGQVSSFFVTREPDQDFRIIANIGEESDTAFVAAVPPPPEYVPILEVAYCVGKGGQEGVRLWGPRGANCNGLPPSSGWGTYDADPRPIDTIGSCKGRGGFEGVTLWGPVGEPCGVPNGDWGLYENPIDVSSAGLSNCVGDGDTLRGHLLWGPTGADCGGFSEWGQYTEATIFFNNFED